MDTLAPNRSGHSHVFLGKSHETSERRTWAVIALCGAMMALEIVGGLLFGSIALVADGLHMSTHAGALLLAALAYRYARRHAADARYTFGTGKLGDLAGFTSAIILAMIALLIGYESIMRLLAPVPIRFSEAIPIAVLGLAVNVGSVWLLGGAHSHDHGHDHGHDSHEDQHTIPAAAGPLLMSVFEDGVPPVFRLHPGPGTHLPSAATIETVRPDGSRQLYEMVNRGGYLESVDSIPEPHAFTAIVGVGLGAERHTVMFAEHDHAHGAAHRDNNLRAAVVHVVADAAVSVLVIIGLLLARSFGWLWMDPLAGIVGACVIASWAYGLVRDTGAILLDMNPDLAMASNVRSAVEANGDTVTDLHLWRLGPGHFGAILSITTLTERTAAYYREQLTRFKTLSHLTIEVDRPA